MSEQTSDPPAPTETEHPGTGTLSKSALKKRAKAERLAAVKLERRAREKAARKEKRRVRAEKRAAGELSDDDQRQTKKVKVNKPDFQGRIIIDLGFDDKMLDKEISSLCSQLAYTYSANRNALYPFNLLFTSLNARTLDKLKSTNNGAYKRWKKTEWCTHDYDRLWQDPSSSHTDKEGGGLTNEDGKPTDDRQKEGQETQDSATELIKEKMVYLTADADEELAELKEDETYIIGGICDHNRYKNLCLDKAQASGIRVARLPIGKYLASLPTRKVLTVNQVFEILAQWVHTRDWHQSLMAVMPKRKFQRSEGEDGSPEVEIGGELSEQEKQETPLAGGMEVV